MYQNGWIFGKFTNGPWSPIFQKIIRPWNTKYTMLAGELYSREKKQMIPPPNAHNLLFSHQSNILLQSLLKPSLTAESTQRCGQGVWVWWFHKWKKYFQFKWYDCSEYHSILNWVFVFKFPFEACWCYISGARLCLWGITQCCRLFLL